MSWTKRQFVLKALSKIGIASYDYDTDPSELQDALVDLDAMMAEWHEKGIRIGWPQTSSPESADLDTESFAPLRANSAIYLNLACRVAPDYGKEASPSVMSLAASTFKTLQSHYVKSPRRRLQGLPAGAGNRHRFRGGLYNGGFNPLSDERDDSIRPPSETIGFTDE